MLGLLRRSVPLAPAVLQSSCLPCRKSPDVTWSCTSRAFSRMAAYLDKESVAVIGAGVAGLCCASSMAERGAMVTVFETGRGPGGRMSQRREKTSDGSQLAFDHGAQYFSVKDPVVQDLVDKWEAAGLVARWEGKFGILDSDTGKFILDSEEGKTRYVGVPGMNSICKALSSQAGIQAKYGVQVVSFSWTEQGGSWSLTSKDEKVLGTYRAVVVADKSLASQRFTALTGLPPPLETAGVDFLSKKVAAATSAPSFALMLAFNEPLTSIPLDGFSVRGSKVLSWVARDSSKPGRPQGRECWVLHSTSEYADGIIRIAGYTKPSEELLSAVANDLLKELQRVVVDVPTPYFQRAHRWGSAFPSTVIAPVEKCLVHEGKRILVCGDFCVGPRVESAILSGLAAADTLAKVLKASGPPDKTGP